MRRHDRGGCRDCKSWRQNDAKQFKPLDVDFVNLNRRQSLRAMCVVYLTRNMGQSPT